jgi:hypothetical protein
MDTNIYIACLRQVVAFAPKVIIIACLRQVVAFAPKVIIIACLRQVVAFAKQGNYYCLPPAGVLHSQNKVIKCAAYGIAQGRGGGMGG